ncbi:MAG TPA: hypothetical protein PKW80_06805 [Bacteroidales bacterium]|nr:hypothetical protein [Bacteroidales bacterium]
MEKQKNRSRKRLILAWLLAVVITLAAAYYQRITGPTYPKKVSSEINGNTYRFSFIRSGSSMSDCEISVPVHEKDIEGFMIYRKYPSNDSWDTLTFSRADGGMTAFLPKQPAAGKLEYYLVFRSGVETIALIPYEPVVIRFKGDVPAVFLLPHVIFMFFAMMFSNVAGILAAFKINKARLYSFITLLLIVLGGMIMGPVVQKFAFGEFWTGVPFGWDLTDNKTLIAFLAWIIAVVANRKTYRPGYVIAAALVTLIIFSIPHSLFGSELNPVTGVVTQG